MLKRRLLLAVLAWLGVVAVVSGVTWAAINAAGQQVLSQSDALPSVREPVLPPDAATGTRLPQPGSTSSRSPSASPESGGTSNGPRPTASPDQPSPRDTPSPEDTQSPGEQGGQSAPQQRTWQGASGSVTVRCEGPQASLQSATPNDGYKVEIRERGPGEVEVRFESEEDEIKVYAACANGIPQFSSES